MGENQISTHKAKSVTDTTNKDILCQRKAKNKIFIPTINIPLYIAGKYHMLSISHFQLIIQMYRISKVITKCKLSFSLSLNHKYFLCLYLKQKAFERETELDIKPSCLTMWIPYVSTDKFPTTTS